MRLQVRGTRAGHAHAADQVRQVRHRAEILPAFAFQSEIDVEVFLDPDQQRGVRQRMPASDIVGGGRHVDNRRIEDRGADRIGS
ncbi:hypothetical protein [Sphingomonas faeni]|uniref:hypothetical protein n=1 Tax=Sphingomonas faeni TaxID=185950 RepID=UPI0020BDBF0D|nr:hypothetical protein [Sphingomonas faeni]MCK8457976.1 hypothetical protein [Sphingomonas faeni]